MNVIAVRLNCQNIVISNKNRNAGSFRRASFLNQKKSEQNNVSFEGAYLNHLKRFVHLGLEGRLENPFKQKAIFERLEITEKEQETFIKAAQWLSERYNILTLCHRTYNNNDYISLKKIQNKCLGPLMAKVLNIHHKNFAVMRADILEKVPNYPEAGPLIYNYAKAEEIKFWLNTNMIFSGIKNSIKDPTEAGDKMLELLNSPCNRGVSKQLGDVIKLYEAVLSTIPDGFSGSCLHNSNSQISLKYELHNKLAIFYNMARDKKSEQKSINVVTKMQSEWNVSDRRNNYPVFDSIFNEWANRAKTSVKNQIPLHNNPEKGSLFSKYGIY